MMQLKRFEQGKLDFISVDAPHKRMKSRLMFYFEGEYYSSEYLAVEYFKSKGYDAFFSENTLFPEIFIT